MPLPDLGSLARRAYRLAHLATALPRPAAAHARRRPVDRGRGAAVPTPPPEVEELAALRHLGGSTAAGGRDRAEHAQRSAAVYLTERRRRLRRELAAGTGGRDARPD